MIGLVLALCLLMIASLVLWPFLKPERGEDINEAQDWGRASLKAALAAIDKDEARGVLTAAAAATQRMDIAKAAKDLPDDAVGLIRKNQGRRGFVVAVVMLILAPFLLLGGYMILGTADPVFAQKQALAAQQSQQPQTLGEAIAAVEARLETEGDNARLWAALGDLKIRNQDLSGAEIALEKAVSLKPVGDDAEHARLWLVLAMTRRSQGLDLSDASIIEPLEMSLALDPESPAGVLLKRAQSETAVEEP